MYAFDRSIDRTLCKQTYRTSETFELTGETVTKLRELIFNVVKVWNVPESSAKITRSLKRLRITTDRREIQILEEQRFRRIDPLYGIRERKPGSVRSIGSVSSCRENGAKYGVFLNVGRRVGRDLGIKA